MSRRIAETSRPPASASDGLSDGLLLRRFAADRDEAAFGVLMRRHGPLVWGVCRRLLRDWHDAEDAYQATFLILARKAGAVNWSDSVANWLYGVAYRVALKARATAERRRTRQQALDEQAAAGAPPQKAPLAGCLDEELHRLPQKYRAPLVLCYLEGMSNEQVAERLGRPIGTVWYQLSRGRELLRARLVRRGVVLTAAGLGVALTQQAASAAVPAALMKSTMVALGFGAAGKTAGTVTATALAQAVLQSMFLAKVKMVSAACLTAAVIAASVGVAVSVARHAESPGVQSEIAGPPREVPPATGRIVGYYPEWGIYDRKFNVLDIPAAKLTHVNYAFAKIENGECTFFDRFAAVEKVFPGDKQDGDAPRGNFHQLQLLKQKHPHLKTLLAVGGWTLSGEFSDVALTEESRTKFAKSCARFLAKYGFDGIDIDWEYPVGGGLEGNKVRPEDRANFTKLLAALRQELDLQGKADGKVYLLTAAAPAGPKNIPHIELDKVHGYLDWFNLMAYDFAGGWSELTNFQAPLYPVAADPSKDDDLKKHNVDAAVKAYLAAGVPADKIVLGVPFYGRGWGGVANGNRGLYQRHAAESPKGTWENGVWDYKDLSANYLGKFERHWHDEAKAPWLFEPRKGIMISYEDPESLRLKAEYINTNRLGGVMIWEVSGDDAKSSLLGSLHRTLRRRE